MTVWNGNRNDISNFVSDKYLQINSCGFQNIIPYYIVVRKIGRYDYHLILIIDGQCRALHKDKDYTLTAGNLIFYAPFEEQKYSFDVESTTMWCHFTGKIVEELLDSCCIKSGAYFLNSDKLIIDSYTKLIRQFNQAGKERFANASFLELIYNISDAIAYPKRKENSNLLLPILTYLNANYNEHITLDELAKKAGYSKSRFSHIFSSVTGTTPMKFQNDIRLKAACEMLSATNHSVTDIALSCGFNDSMYFSKIFKRKYNVTPTEYRNSGV